jgi:Domain of unknown function (DUF3854)
MIDNPTPPTLSIAHAEMLQASGIHPALITARSYFTATSNHALLRDLDYPLREEYAHHQLADYQQRFPALVIPQYSLGHFSHVIIRPDDPRTSRKPNGQMRSIKYEQPAGVAPILDLLPMFTDALADRHVPIWWTEGSRKADAIASHFDDVVPLSILGTWGWQRKSIDDENLLLPAFDSFPVRDRVHVIALDEDMAFNENVFHAGHMFKSRLLLRGATVGMLNLHAVRNEWEQRHPDTVSNHFASMRKWGVDDALGAGVQADFLRSHIDYVRLDDTDRRFWRYLRRLDQDTFGL